MDNTVEKTSDIERKAALNKLHNMQWLKNTSYSANPEKIKAIVYKQVPKDEDKKIEDEVSAVTETVKKLLSKGPDKYSSTSGTCETYLCDDTMLENDENVWSKNIDTANLFPNADKLADPKNEEDMLSIVESIVTAKLEAEFYINKEQKDQSSTSENNTEGTMQDAVSTSPSDLQKTDGGAKEVKLIKHSDGNNNDSKSTTPLSKVNGKQKSTCKVTTTESSKTSTEVKDKDVSVKTNITKTGIKAGSNTNLTKDNEKFSSSSNDSKKAVSNLSKSLSTTDKTGRDHFNNKQNNIRNTGTRRQEFVRQRNVSRDGIEKETKNAVAKPNLAKTGVETADMCQNKNLNRDKALQKQQTTPKQYASKSKGQDSLRRNTPTPNLSDDKNKTEKATHTPENVDSPLNESEKKSEKEKNLQSDQRANRDVDFRKNTTFVAQYRNSTFSKPTQNIPKHAPTYGRNPSYTYNNPRFDRDRNGSAERRVPKREHTPINTFTKSDTGTEELDTSNVENCAKQKNEVIQPINVKSTSECIDLTFNDRKDINPVNVETQSKENTSSSVDYSEQGPTTSEECRVDTSDISKIDIDQQYRETSNEETDSFKHSSNFPSDKCSTNSQINMTRQYSLNPENVQRTNDVNQFENSQTTWNQSSDNAAQNGATVMSLQQSIQNVHFNTQPTFTQAGNPTRQMSPWESNNSKFYDQHFSVSDAMRLSQIPNTFSVPPPYEYNAPISNDNSVTSTSTLETTMSNNRENSNVLYGYGPNVQQRPIMASDYSGHSLSPCQTNQARWSTLVQDCFHVEHPYVAAQPTMMHVYNPAAFGPDDFNNTHTMDYVSHPVMYAPSPYMQTWNSQLQYPMPVLYNSPCTNYTTFPHSDQPNNFSNVHNQQHKHNPYAQMNSYVRDMYNDTNTCAVQARNTADNVPVKSNYYYKKYQDNCRAVHDVPQYAPPVSYSRSQPGMNFMPATGQNQYNAPYCPPNQRYYKQNVTNYMKSPKSQIQDFASDDNGSAEDPPIISPKEFVTDNINLSNKTDQIATRVFKPEFRTKPNLGYRPPPSFPRGGFRRNTTFQDFPKEYTTYPISIGRGTYKTKRT